MESHGNLEASENTGAFEVPQEAEDGWSTESNGVQEKVGLGGGRIHLKRPRKTILSPLDFAPRVQGSHGRLEAGG